VLPIASIESQALAWSTLCNEVPEQRLRERVAAMRALPQWTRAPRRSGRYLVRGCSLSLEDSHGS